MSPTIAQPITQRPVCFGFYNGSPTCLCCKAQKRCKAVTATDGLEILASLIEDLTSRCQDGAGYRDTDRTTDLTEQLLNAPPAHAKDPADKNDLLATVQALMDKKGRQDPTTSNATTSTTKLITPNKDPFLDL